MPSLRSIRLPISINKSPTWWILMVHAIVGCYLCVRQMFAIVVSQRNIGFWKEYLLFVDVLTDVSVSVFGLHGLEQNKENWLFPAMYAKSIKFGYNIMTIAEVGMVLNTVSNPQQLSGEFISSIEWLGTEAENSMSTESLLLAVLVVSALIYPIDMFVNISPEEAASTYEGYFILNTFFQAISAGVIMRHIMLAKRRTMLASVKSWIFTARKLSRKARKTKAKYSTVDEVTPSSASAKLKSADELDVDHSRKAYTAEQQPTEVDLSQQPSEYGPSAGQRSNLNIPQQRPSDPNLPERQQQPEQPDASLSAQQSSDANLPQQQPSDDASLSKQQHQQQQQQPEVGPAEKQRPSEEAPSSTQQPSEKEVDRSEQPSVSLEIQQSVGQIDAYGDEKYDVPIVTEIVRRSIRLKGVLKLEVISAEQKRQEDLIDEKADDDDDDDDESTNVALFITSKVPDFSMIGLSFGLPTLVIVLKSWLDV